MEIAKQATNGLTYLMADRLREHGVTAVTVAPTGWVWDWESLLAARQQLREGRELDAGLLKGESPEYTGRGISMLAADPARLERSGRVWGAHELAQAYRFTDIDGRQPDHSAA